MIPEEWVKLGDILEDGDNLRHEGTNVLVILVVRPSFKIFNVNERDIVVLKESSLQRSYINY